MKNWGGHAFAVVRGALDVLELGSTARADVLKACEGCCAHERAQVAFAETTGAPSPAHELDAESESAVARAAAQAVERMPVARRDDLARAAKAIVAEPAIDARARLAVDFTALVTQATLASPEIVEKIVSGPQIGHLIAGKYRLMEPLGRGGFGTVFRAFHEHLGKDVALKLLNPSLSKDPDTRRRFLKEVEAMAAFVHRYAVQLRDFGEDAGSLYFTMDLVAGKTLRQVMTAEKIGVDRAVRIACEVLEVLEEAHKAGLVHRDLKPENLMLSSAADGTEEVRVLDFGIAKAISRSQKSTDALTQSGAIVGTIGYMSPEQAEGDKLDGRSDVFSLGVIVFEMLAGKKPFEAKPGAEDAVRSYLTTLITRDAPDLRECEHDSRSPSFSRNWISLVVSFPLKGVVSFPLVR